MMQLHRVGLSLAALALTASGALAQQEAPRKPVTPTTIKTVGGWDVRCYPVQSLAPCEMWEAVAFKGTTQLAASLSIVYIPARDSYAVQIVLPFGMDFSKGARLAAGDYTSEVLHFERCERIGCLVAMRDGNGAADALRGQAAVKVKVTWFHGKSMDITVPLKGYDEARSALVEAAKQKAAKPDASAAAPSP
ncbi:MAG: invasion associated locus B family protein [Alphaproteobacteria bacterium]|nr:invasion associated locus B family protein [Alphaproteobacteria bacterium]